MSQVEAIARETDRLVWAVSHAVVAEHATFPVSSQLRPSTFGPLLNLIVWRAHLTEDVIRRRYIYRPDDGLDDFVADLEASGLCSRAGKRLVPTDLLTQVASEMNAAIDTTARRLWHNHEEEVAVVSELAREVVHAAEDRHGLLVLAQTIPEATDPFHLCWQHLTALRLVRNQAHVEAWTTFELSAGDVEVLTDAWAGTEVQAPIVHSDNLVARSFVENGSVTELGIEVRQQIEDATDAGVTAAYNAIDPAEFLHALRAMPPFADS